MTDSLMLPQVGGFSETKLPNRAELHGKAPKGDPGFEEILDTELNDATDQPEPDPTDTEGLAYAVAAMLAQPPPTAPIPAASAGADAGTAAGAGAATKPAADAAAEPAADAAAEPAVAALAGSPPPSPSPMPPSMPVESRALPAPLAPTDSPSSKPESPALHAAKATNEPAPATPAQTAEPPSTGLRVPAKQVENVPAPPPPAETKAPVVAAARASSPAATTAAKYAGTTASRMSPRPNTAANGAAKAPAHTVTTATVPPNTKPLEPTAATNEASIDHDTSDERHGAREGAATTDEAKTAGSLTKANTMTSSDGAPTITVTAHADGNPSPAKPTAIEGRIPDAPRVEHQVGARVREAALESADKHAVARGVRAEVDLGESGRIAISAAEKAHSIDVKLDAQTTHTAQTIAKHASELVSELRHQTEYARVTVNGQGSFSSGRSSHGGSSHSYASNQGGDRSSSSHRDGANQSEAHEPGPAPRAVGRKVRIVL